MLVYKRPLLEFKIAKPKSSFHDLISSSSLHYHKAVPGKHLPKVLRQSKHYNAYSNDIKTFPPNLDVFPNVPRSQKPHTFEWPNFLQQLYALWQTFAKSRCQLTRCTRSTRSYQQRLTQFPNTGLWSKTIFTLSNVLQFCWLWATFTFSFLLFLILPNYQVASNKVSTKVKAISFAENGSYFVTAGNRQAWNLFRFLNLVGFGTFHLTVIEIGMSSSGTWSTLVVPNTRSLYLSWEGMCLLIIFIIIITIIHFALVIIMIMIHYLQVCNSWRAEEQLFLWCGLWQGRDGEYYCYLARQNIVISNRLVNSRERSLVLLHDIPGNFAHYELESYCHGKLQLKKCNILCKTPGMILQNLVHDIILNSTVVGGRWLLYNVMDL